MRTLVVGSYPPPATPDAHRTVATVHRLGARGDTVDVLAPHGTAAQLRGAIAGPRGALGTWWRGRRYDAVVVHVEAGAPLRRNDGRRARADRAVDCLAWGLALRRLRHVTLVVADADAVPRSVGGRTGRFLWTAADEVLVTNERSRRRLVDDGGAPAERVVLPASTGAVATGAGGWDGVGDAADVMAHVRRRAADDRRAARRGELDAGV